MLKNILFSRLYKILAEISGALLFASSDLKNIEKDTL